MSKPEESDILFREKQRMNPRLGAIVIGIILLTMSALTLVTRPGADPIVPLYFVLTMCVCSFVLPTAVLLLVYYKHEMVTEVATDRLLIRCDFLMRRPVEIPLEGIVSHRVVSAPSQFALQWQHRQKLTLSIRKCRLWIMCGAHGVRIDYANGDYYLIGSQKPEELNDAIGHGISTLLKSVQ